MGLMIVDGGAVVKWCCDDDAVAWSCLGFEVSRKGFINLIFIKFGECKLWRWLCLVSM